MNYKVINKLNNFEFPLTAETDEEAIKEFKDQWSDSLDFHILKKTVDIVILDGSLENEETTKSSSNINHPSHYNQGKKETIEIIEESTTDTEYIGFLKGNIIKYISRCEYKNNEVEDLKKAQWYLQKLIDFKEKG